MYATSDTSRPAFIHPIAQVRILILSVLMVFPVLILILILIILAQRWSSQAYTPRHEDTTTELCLPKVPWSLNVHERADLLEGALRKFRKPKIFTDKLRKKHHRDYMDADSSQAIVGGASFTHNRTERHFLSILKDVWFHDFKYSAITLVWAGNDLMSWSTPETLTHQVADLLAFGDRCGIPIRLVDVVGEQYRQNWTWHLSQYRQRKTSLWLITRGNT